MVVLYDEVVGEFDFVNKEHQPRAVTRLNSTSESEKIESHGNHALSNERWRKFRPWFSFDQLPISSLSQPTGPAFGSIDFSLVLPYCVKTQNFVIRRVHKSGESAEGSDAVKQ